MDPMTEHYRQQFIVYFNYFISVTTLALFFTLIIIFISAMKRRR